MSNRVHIMAINETNCQTLPLTVYFQLKIFALKRKDRNVCRSEISLYVQNTISYKVIKTLPQHSLELLCIEVIPKHAKSFFVVSWYGPPDYIADKFQDLENVISYLETFQKEIIFLGDTNCNLLEGNLCASGPAKHMSSFYASFGFKLLINEPARVTLDTKTHSHN